MSKAKAKVTKKQDHEYTFDVKFFAAVSVNAASAKQARQRLEELLDQAVLNLGKNGRKRHTADVSPDGEHELMEIDGEDADDPEEGLSFEG